MSKKNREKRVGRQAHSPTGAARKKLYLILGVVAILALVLIGYSVSSGGGQAATQPIEVEGLDDPEQLVAMAQGMAMGDEDAPVTVVEFGDYQCPGCAYFGMTIKPQIESELVETGKVRFVYYDFPLVGSGHPHAFLAARAARCAMDQDRGWDYHEALFVNQTRWSPTGDPSDLFVEYAAQLGLDEGAFESCLNSAQHAEVVTANMRLGQELGVSGTPTVLVGEGRSMARRIGMAGDPWTEISQEVERLLAAQGDEADSPDEAGEDGSGG